MGQAKNEQETAKLASLVRKEIAPRMRAAYEALDEAPLPSDQIELLLALRHKERERRRRAEGQGE